MTSMVVVHLRSFAGARETASGTYMASSDSLRSVDELMDMSRVLQLRPLA